MSELKPIDIADLVSRLAADGESLEGFLNAMKHQHRTLQQAFTGLCFKWIEVCAKQDYDARNCASVMTCRKIVENCDLDELPFL